MRLLLICRSMPWHMAGGLENHAWDLAQGLAARGDDVHVLTTAARQGHPAPSLENITIHECAAAVPGRYSASTFRALADEAERLHGRLAFDAIHAQGFAANAFPARLAGKLAITVHGTLTSETLLYPPLFERLTYAQKASTLWRHKGRIASAPLFNRALRMARIILVDSDFTRRELLRSAPHLEPKIWLVPLGVHPERVPPQSASHLPHSPLRLLSVGRLTAMKGMHVALQGLGQLKGLPWRWTVAGTGPELQRLRAQCGELGLKAQVEFLGEVSESSLRELREQSDVFLYPELGYPAFGLVALEAMLSGLPVLASDLGAIPEVVTAECGWLVRGDDPAALAQKIHEIMEDPVAIELRSKRCRESALSRFSFEAMVDGTRRALGEV